MNLSQVWKGVGSSSSGGIALKEYLKKIAMTTKYQSVDDDRRISDLMTVSVGGDFPSKELTVPHLYIVVCDWVVTLKKK